jgi:benzoyl-CoA reductase/2-hydroxyglutaryl-CoA dehydratase subunit BcrC/BadD/HgdB
VAGAETKLNTNDDSLSRFYRRPLTDLMNRYYEKLAQLAKRRDMPVAWITTMVPIELLNAAGLFPFYPENYAALCAARGRSKDLIGVAESKEISRDLCGYATCNIGSVLMDEWASGKGEVPLPDMLIATRLTCNIHIGWWQYLSRRLQVPLFIMDAPYRSSARYEEKDIEYFVLQLRRLVAFIEEKAGNPISGTRLEEVMALSDQASLYWGEISESRQTIPSPLASNDVFSLMFPMVTLAGTEDAVTFFKMVAEEIRRRAAGDAPHPGKERYRLIWDLFPPWHDMKLWKIFDEAGATFVIDFYADAFSGRLTKSDPYRSLADKYLFNPSLQRGIAAKRDLIEKVARDYHLDGAVFMSNRSCRYFSLGQLDLASHVRNELGLPVLFFEGDHMDPSHYSRESVERQVYPFLEGLSARKNS